VATKASSVARSLKLSNVDLAIVLGWVTVRDAYSVDIVTTACQSYNATLDSLNCLNDALSSEASINTIIMSIFSCLLPFGEIKLNINQVQCIKYNYQI